MSQRTGICTSCGAQYGNIPPTVTATKVRCRKCQGVVEIPPAAAEGPKTGARPAAPQPKPPPRPAPPAPPPKPPAKPAPPSPPPKPPARPAPPSPPPKPPAKPAPPSPPPKPPPAQAASTLEDLLSLDDLGAPTAPVPASMEPAEPLTDEEARKAKAAALMARLKAEKAAASGATEGGKAGTSRAAAILAEARAKRTRDKAGEPEQVQRKAPPGPAELKGPPKPPRPGRKKARAGSRRSSRRSAREPAKTGRSKAPLLVALFLLLGGGGFAAWWFVLRDTPRTGAEVRGAAPAQPEAQAAPAPAEPEAAPEDIAAEIPPAEPSPAEELPPPPEPAPAPLFTPPEAGQVIVYKGITDPAVLDLAAVQLVPKFSATPEEDWKTIVADLELYLEDSGAQSNRAGKRLVAASRDAFPAIVNALLRLDYNDPDQVRIGGTMNKLIADIGKGTNQPWREVDLLEPGTKEYDAAIVFDKKVAANWYNLWVTKFSVDDAQWAGFASKESERLKQIEAARREQLETQAPSVNPFDD